ncbi:MAG TPA: DUF6785 family protein [Chthonomonadaceae bacterium]|nr:DUF6785 family protein [Chthonomonadaceae bacterium]
MSAQPETRPQAEQERGPARAPAGPRPQGVTPRALIIGLVLIPTLCFWNEYTEIVAEATDLAAMSLIIAVVFALFVLLLINLALKRFAPRFALSQAELMFVYIMQTCSIGISGIGRMQFLNTFVGNIFYYSTPENGWRQKLLPAVRPWLLPDERVTKAFYSGQSNFWTADHIAGWLAPICVWSVYIIVMIWVMLCLNALIRKHWMDRERLSFPIVQLPLELTREGGASNMLLSRQMWIGFLIPVILESLASINYLYPNVPFLPIKPSDPRLILTPLFNTPPWTGIGYLALSFYPLVIGLTYFLPLDVAFSLWFFYLFTKFENVAATILGYHDAGASQAVSRMPYVGEQSAGAFLGMALFVLYGMRRQLREIVVSAFSRARPRAGSDTDDTNEPMPYRLALLGGLAGLAALVAFGIVIGMAWWVPIVFYGCFYLYVITFTRIRAEAGLPWGYAPDMNVHDLMKSTFGTRGFTFQSQVGLNMVLWHDLDYRCTEMPNELEGMKIGESARMNLRHVALVIMLAAVVGALSSWAAVLTCYYHYGAATAKVNGWRTSMGLVPWRTLKDWVDNPVRADFPRLQGVGVGLLVTAGLLMMRQRFTWWPFHPIGYAVAGTSTMTWLWCATFVGWGVKWLVIRYGGMKTYRAWIPFFIGLILGDYITGSVWAIFGSITGIHTYRAFPI